MESKFLPDWTLLALEKRARLLESALTDKKTQQFLDLEPGKDKHVLQELQMATEQANIYEKSNRLSSVNSYQGSVASQKGSLKEYAQPRLHTEVERNGISQHKASPPQNIMQEIHIDSGTVAAPSPQYFRADSTQSQTQSRPFWPINPAPQNPMGQVLYLNPFIVQPGMFNTHDKYERFLSLHEEQIRIAREQMDLQKSIDFSYSYIPFQAPLSPITNYSKNVFHHNSVVEESQPQQIVYQEPKKITKSEVKPKLEETVSLRVQNPVEEKIEHVKPVSINNTADMIEHENIDKNFALAKFRALEGSNAFKAPNYKTYTNYSSKPKPLAPAVTKSILKKTSIGTRTPSSTEESHIVLQSDNRDDLDDCRNVSVKNIRTKWNNGNSVVASSNTPLNEMVEEYDTQINVVKITNEVHNDVQSTPSNDVLRVEHNEPQDEQRFGLQYSVVHGAAPSEPFVRNARVRDFDFMQDAELVEHVSPRMPEDYTNDIVKVMEPTNVYSNAYQSSSNGNLVSDSEDSEWVDDINALNFEHYNNGVGNMPSSPPIKSGLYQQIHESEKMESEKKKEKAISAIINNTKTIAVEPNKNNQSREFDMSSNEMSERRFAEENLRLEQEIKAAQAVLAGMKPRKITTNADTGSKPVKPYRSISVPKAEVVVAKKRSSPPKDDTFTIRVDSMDSNLLLSDDNSVPEREGYINDVIVEGGGIVCEGGIFKKATSKGSKVNFYPEATELLYLCETEATEKWDEINSSVDEYSEHNEIGSNSSLDESEGKTSMMTF